MEALRLFQALFLVIALVLGQAEACHQMYVRADGTACPTCQAPFFANTFESGKTDVSVFDGDCQKCCRLAPCLSNHGAKAKALPLVGNQFEIAALPQRLTVKATATIASSILSVHVYSSLPNAPPLQRAGRSPPLQLS
jgi:hypothetical protein